MSDHRKVAFEADRLIEVLFGGEKTLEDIAATTPWSAEQLRGFFSPATKEDSMALFEAALRLNVSPLWLMGYDAPQQQTEYEQKLGKMLFVTDKMAERPTLLDIISRMSTLSDDNE